MPTYREKVYICPDQNGQPVWITEFPIWWDRAGFLKKYGGRQIDTGNPFYVDYGLLMTGWEAKAWDKQCRAHFAGNPRSRLPSVIETMDRLESMLQAASWVIVESSEWESGLN